MASWRGALALMVGREPRYARIAVLLLCGGALVPLPSRHRHARGAFLLFGVPWLAFFAAGAFSQIGRFTAYSGDDWLAYQVAGYRIFMHGYWLEGGSKAFDYQPLYRWISGGLHLMFGDSSVGETYLDAASLLAGALLAFHLTKAVAGYRAGMLAAAGTLATFTIGTTWYFVGRGLSEIAAAGCAFLAMSFLLRARLGRASTAIAAGTRGVDVHTRLNYLISPRVFRCCCPSNVRVRARRAARSAKWSARVRPPLRRSVTTGILLFMTHVVLTACSASCGTSEEPQPVFHIDARVQAP